MKTAEEIKKGLEICQIKYEGKKLLVCDPDECPYGPQTLKCKSELHADAYSYIKQLEAENERTMNCYDAAVCETADVADMLPKWISVEERMPEKGKTVLVAFTDGYVTIGTLWGDCWVIPYSYFEDPVSKGTWWMPLPEPPEVTKP